MVKAFNRMGGLRERNRKIWIFGSISDETSERAASEHDCHSHGYQPLSKGPEKGTFSVSDCDIADNMTQTQSSKDPHCPTSFRGLSAKLSACVKVWGGGEWICYQLIAPSGQSACCSPSSAGCIHRTQLWNKLSTR